MMTQLFNISLLIACPTPDQPVQPVVAPKPIEGTNVVNAADVEQPELKLSPPGVIFDGVDFNDRMLKQIRQIA